MVRDSERSEGQNWRPEKEQRWRRRIYEEKENISSATEDKQVQRLVLIDALNVNSSLAFVFVFVFVFDNVLWHC